jgi:hypothetical protein
VVPLGRRLPGFRYFGYRAYGYVGDSSHYWRFLYTDRHLYRPTDAIHFWGLVRARENPCNVGPCAVEEPKESANGISPQIVACVWRLATPRRLWRFLRWHRPGAR